MDHVPHDAGLEASGKSLTHAKHLKAAYRLACHQRQDAIVLRLTRVDGDNPAGIQWRIPVEGGYQSIFIEVLDDGTLKVMGSPNGVIYT